MLTFLIEENVLTATTLSSIFTVGMVNSLRINVIEPAFEKIIPSHKFNEKDSFNVLPVLTTGGSQPAGAPPNKTIRWKIFLRDFLIWLLIMFFLFILWKKFFHPIKQNIKKV